MARLKLGAQPVAHRLVREQIITFTREQPAHCDLVILIRFDSELTPMMTIRNQSLVELLNREWKREVFRVTVPDVAHEAMKYSI